MGPSLCYYFHYLIKISKYIYLISTYPLFIYFYVFVWYQLHYLIKIFNCIYLPHILSYIFSSTYLISYIKKLKRLLFNSMIVFFFSCIYVFKYHIYPFHLLVITFHMHHVYSKFLTCFRGTSSRCNQHKKKVHFIYIFSIIQTYVLKFIQTLFFL